MISFELKQTGFMLLSVSVLNVDFIVSIKTDRYDYKLKVTVSHTMQY